jgi:hypothetical protein
MKMNTKRIGHALVTATLAVMVACGSDEKESDDDASSPSSSNASTGSSSGTTCTEACITHETNCGAPSPAPFCEDLCAMYQPLDWQVECAEQVACGDEAGLLACMPDLECVSKCVAHEEDCGDPSPQAGCEQLCNEFRPTLSQVSCAQAVECGDQQGLADCVAPP